MLYLFLSLIPYVHAQSADLVAAFQRFNPHAKYSVPAPTAKEQAILKSGKVVTRIDRPIAGDSAAQRALGMMVSKSTVEKLWVACQDTHFTQQESTKELRVSITERNKSRTKRSPVVLFSGVIFYNSYGTNEPSPFADLVGLCRSLSHNFAAEGVKLIWTQRFQKKGFKNDTLGIPKCSHFTKVD